MKKNCMDKMIGKFCKIVTKEPGQERASVIIGKITDINHDEGLVMIESEQGEGCISIGIVEAIKPMNKKINV